MTAAVVGPNAILQTAAALEAHGGRALVRRTFGVAGLAALIDNPPEAMVPQDMAASLFRAVQDTLPADGARQVAIDAGRRTGTYILQNRIPAPARLAGPLLLRAVAAHAWTFAGSGRVTIHHGPPARLEIHDNPLALARCDWHRAVLETLFRRLVHPEIAVTESTCRRDGVAVSVFEFRRAR
jgi:divinyl protochlorophyllide a 8-vinyl-reductase